MELVSTVEAGDRWVTHCAWAPWRVSDAETGTCDVAAKPCGNIQPPVVSILACGLSNGDVVLIDITQKLLPAPSGSQFSPEVTTEIRDENAAVPDKRTITAMKWISRKDNAVIDPMLCAQFTPHAIQPMLVYCKPGTAHLYTTPSPSARWSGHVEIRPQNQKTSRNSSELHPCCGIEYNHDDDSVVLAINDGSLHVIGGLGETPKYVDSAESGLSSRGLSALARNTFLKSEGRGATDAVTGKISGMSSLCNGSILLWIFE